MGKLLFIALFTMITFAAAAQGIVVNADKTHSPVHGSVVINPDGTHSTIHGSIVINPNGTHSTLVGSTIINPSGTTSTIIGAGHLNDNGNLPAAHESALKQHENFLKLKNSKSDRAGVQKFNWNKILDFFFKKKGRDITPGPIILNSTNCKTTT